MSKFFKSLKKAKKAAEPQPPRVLTAIQDEYANLLAKAGQAQYLISVYQKDLSNLNNELVRVNQEAAARQALDKATQTTESDEVTDYV